MNITVRKAEYSDLEQVNALRRQVHQVHVTGRPDIFRPGFCDELQQRVYEFMEREDCSIIVACLDDRICGMAVVHSVERPQTGYNNERRFYHVEEFGVDGAYRRQGVATALMDYIRKDAAAQGFQRIELDCWEFNHAAIAFYEKAGFTVFRRFLELNLS